MYFYRSAIKILQKQLIYTNIYLLVVQRITKLTVRIILQILSHGSDNFSDQQKNNNNKFAFHLLLKWAFKYFYTPAETTSLTI